jgi:hypothetical protein
LAVAGGAQVVSSFNSSLVQYLEFAPLHMHSLAELDIPGGMGCNFHPSVSL